MTKAQPNPAAAVVAPLESQKISARLFLLVLSAVCLGYALQPNNGALTEKAIMPFNVAVICAVAALLVGDLGIQHKLAPRVAGWSLAAGFSFQLFIHLTSQPGAYTRGEPNFMWTFFEGMAALAVLSGAGLSNDSWLGRLRFPAFLAIYFVLGIWIIQHSPNPWIDVYLFQHDSADALLSGQNPYAITFPDIYGASQKFYGPGLSVGGRVQFGFPYFPLSLLAILPSHKIFGDPRYMHLACVIASAGFIAYSKPSRIAEAAAALFLLTPRGLFVIEQSWTEPLVLVGFTGTIFVAHRFPRALPWVLGLFLATKQYLVMIAPAALFFLPRPYLRRENLIFVGKAVGIALAVSLPLVLWNFGAFWHSVVALQTIQPFRADSLSYLAIWLQQGRGLAPTAIAFILPLVVIVVGYFRAGATPKGFALTCAIAMFMFFAFNKQAFANYYFFVIGALCLAAALTATVEPALPKPVASGGGTGNVTKVG